MIFEPGVTTRHLSPVLDDPDAVPHGAGLSLYHLKNAAVSAEVLSASSPTAIRTTFDTRTLPERTLQSGSRPSKSNLAAALQDFAERDLTLFYASPARILATLIKNQIVQRPQTTAALRERATALGLEVSLRTVQRVWRGEIGPVQAVVPGDRSAARRGREPRPGQGDGPVLALGEQEMRDITDILRRAARASYLELGELKLEVRPGELSVRARVYEPEEEYE